MKRFHLNQKERKAVRRGLSLFLSLLLFQTVFPIASFAATATQTLGTPEPKVEGKYTASWKKVSHAGSYEVKVEMQPGDGEKAVTRTVVVDGTKLDLTLFAAGNTVTYSVRALPASGSKYKKGSFAVCKEEIEPSEDNETYGFAGVEKSRYYLADSDNKKMEGWKKVNGSWYYFDPKNSCLTASGWADINGGTYYFTSMGKMETGWTAIDNHWYFFKSSGADEGNMVTGWQEAMPNTRYYFTETASEGKPRGSLDMETTRATYPDAKAPKELSGTGVVSGPGASTTEVAPTSYWRQNPNATWSYYQDGKLVTGKWLAIDGFWYCFDSSGIMLTGWQFINSRWYYLEPARNGSNGYPCGAMWVNATTPDGYTVNEAGQWVIDGEPVTTKTVTNKNTGTNTGTTSGSTGKTAPASTGSVTTGTKKIATCAISLQVSDGEEGKCRKAVVTGATNATVTSQTYSKPYEEWSAGNSVTITVVLTAKSGYCFHKDTKFTCTNAKVAGKTGDDTERTVTLTYTPVKKLPAVKTVYVTDDDTLRWIPVTGAKRYKVTFSGGDLSGSKSVYLTEAEADLTEYGQVEGGGLKATIIAMGAEGNKFVIESSAFSTGDLEEFKAEHFDNGIFTRKEGGRVLYTDEYGEKATGWTAILGYWFHFKKNGLSETPGWYEDADGAWYYFDTDCRMQTGNVTVDGTTYFLNDGSRTDLPVGAWVR